ncbi:MAG: hypothetical protein ACP5US_12770, partial [Candidatus Kryptoniota bacterium]
MMELRRVKRVLILGLVLGFYVSHNARARMCDDGSESSISLPGLISINVTPEKVSIGDTVKIAIDVKEDMPVNASLLIPDKGVFDLKLKHIRRSIYISQVAIDDTYPQGIYVVQAWQGDRHKPATVGKVTFLYGKIIGDFCSIGIFDSVRPGTDMDTYLKEMKGFGANFLIASGIITSNRVYYNSKICTTESSFSVYKGYLDTLLNCADENGYFVMLPATWDMTRNIPYPGREANIKKISEELYINYCHHPSFAGFYI